MKQDNAPGSNHLDGEVGGHIPRVSTTESARISLGLGRCGWYNYKSVNNLEIGRSRGNKHEAVVVRRVL